MTRICPKCSSEIDAAAKLCTVCLFGEGLKTDTVVCAKCHNALDQNVRYCPHCGAMVPASSTLEGDPIQTALAAKLASQYRIVRLLGQGGMGSVYLARDLTLEREVAIKVIKTDEESREIYDRFRREAKTAAKLSHPNIVPLHAFGEVEGMPYFVMGYVRGESLADRLRREGKLSEEDARRIFAEIASALDHAHRQGIVHRDIKPDNVLLEDESGRALLTDFGVAKAADKGETMTRHGSVIGTPHYMSPEQASGRSDIDGRSDIYSLGVMAYAMLAGRLPFEGKTAAEILTQHLTRDPAPIRTFAPAASDSTVQAIDRCLVKDPAARWPDARSLKLILGGVEESQLPDSLQAAESRGITALWITWTTMLIFALVPQDFIPNAMVAGTMGAFWFFYFFAVARLRREGFSLGEAQSVIWREPAWWLWWYPKALRRRGNVWERLPAAVRHVRVAMQLLLTYVFGVVCNGVYFIGGLMDDFDAMGRYVNDWRTYPVAFASLTGSLIAIVSAWFLFTVRARRELRRRSLAEADVSHVMMSIPPSRVGFWARPHITAILAPVARAETIPQSESPHDHMQSILRHADELSGPLRPLGTQAAAAARQLVAAIDHAEREISDLARNIEPGEAERLAEKIEALSALENAGDEFSSMRPLLERQLELIRALSARIEEAKERRNRRVEMLRALALHVASLRARVTETPSELRQISDNVRTLCDDIGRQALSTDPVVRRSGDDAMETVRRA